MYQLRPYQTDAVAATLSHFRRTNESAVIVLPTGAGKSLVIAELARLARKNILVLTHVKELVEQNHQKFQEYADHNGVKSGVYSAGLGLKQTTQQVTFASIQSVGRNLQDFAKHFSLVIIDECHRVASIEKSDELGGNQYAELLTKIKKINSNLKILGLTATPYRLGIGWIYQYHYHGIKRNTESAPFTKCIYELPLGFMIKNGYLTPPKLVDAPVAYYDFSNLESNNQGHFAEAEVNQLLVKYPRVTEAITEQILEYGAERKGVMIFAASIKHAEEIVGYLGNERFALITGATKIAERDELIRRFKQKEIKYLVNVAVLTTGFDAPHVDFIAILRPTESVSLYQQIVGRGLRLAPDKTDCLVVDYAGNGINIFYPEVGAKKPDSNSELVQVFCPSCGFANMFWGKTDGEGQVTEHYGRLCQGVMEDEESGEREECDYRFVFKECPQCHGENDIAARQCRHCEFDLVDPDDKLKDALKLKDGLVIRCAGVEFSAEDNTLLLIYHDEEGCELKERFDFGQSGRKKAFNQMYGRRFAQSRAPKEFSSAAEVLEHQNGLPCPDFVIARKQKHYFKVVERIFDYQGRYRKANEL